MNKDQLIKKLYTYTPIEEELMKHYEIRNDYKLIEDFNANLDSDSSKEVMSSIVSKYISEEGEELPLFPVDYFFSEDDLIKIKVTQHTRYSTPIPHYHNFYEILYVYEGNFEQTINHQTIRMISGDICIISPGVHHSLDVNNYSIVLNLIIENDTLIRFLRDDFSTSTFFAPLLQSVYATPSDYPFYIVETFGDRLIKDLFLSIYLETLNKETSYPALIHSYLLQLLTQLERQHQDSTTVYNTLKNQELLDFKLLKKMDQEYATITLAALAEEFHYSSQFISHRIKQLTNKTFQEFITDKRLSVACQLLEHSNFKVKEISYKVGYQNEEHFSRLFKKHFQAPPLQYRKQFNSAFKA